MSARGTQCRTDATPGHPPAAHADRPLLAEAGDGGHAAGLRVGDVIPVTFDSSDVLIGDARLFTAAVTEHKGKLCLTSFADVE